jgi:hypothetical protein
MPCKVYRQTLAIPAASPQAPCASPLAPGKPPIAGQPSLLSRQDLGGQPRRLAIHLAIDARPNAPPQTINNHRDVTFNQLLGINDHGKIAGYFGSGAQGHPNKGYVISPPYGQGNFRSENFPGSVQTQVTGLNTSKVTVGFWSTQNKASGANNNFGFYAVNGRHFHKVDFPTRHPASPPVDQLLGVNNHDVAVGFFQKASGNTQGYLYNIRTGRYLTVPVPGGVSTAATAINDPGSIAGFFTNSAGVTKVFLLRHTGQLIVLQHPHASTTQALGGQQQRRGRRLLRARQRKQCHHARLHLDPQPRVQDR